MGQDVDIRTLVSVETDKGIDAARKELKEVVKAQQDLVDEFKKGDKSAADFSKELSKLAKEEKTLEKAIDAVTNEFTEYTKAMREAERATEEFRREQDELGSAQGRFDKVSQDVALAGDFEGASRTVGGALGAAGFSGAERVISKGSEIPALIEALPKMKAAAAGLPSAFNAAATGMKTSTTALGGLIVAFAALALAAKIAGDAAKKRVGINEAIFNAEMQRNDFESQSTEELLADLKKKQEASILAAGDAKKAAEAAEQFREKLGLLGQALLKIGSIFGVGSELDFVEQDESAAAAAAAGLEKEIAITKEILKTRGVNTEALQENAQAQSKATAAEKARTQALETSTKAVKLSGDSMNAGQLARAHSGEDSVVTAARARAKASKARLKENLKQREQIEKDGAKDLAEVQRENAQEFLDLKQEEADSRFNLELDNFRAIEDSMRDFKRSREDALRDGNFLGLRDIAIEEKRAAQDRKGDMERSQSDITRDSERALQELTQTNNKQWQEIVNNTTNAMEQATSSAERFSRRFPALLSLGMNRLMQDQQTRSLFANAPRTGR